MGNKQSTPQLEINDKYFEPTMSDMIKSFGYKNYKTVMEFLKEPGKILDTERKWSKFRDSAGGLATGFALGQGVGYGHHMLHRSLLFLVGTSSGLIRAVQYGVIATSIVIMVVQIYQLKQIGCLLAKQSKLLAEVNKDLTQEEVGIIPQVVKLLEKCNKKDWESINLREIENLLKKIETHTENLEKAKKETEKLTSRVRVTSGIGVVASAISVGLLCLGITCFSAGIGGILIFGCFVAGCIAQSSYCLYKSRKCTKSIEQIDQLLNKLNLVKITLEIIKKNAKYGKMKDKDFENEFRNTDLNRFNDCEDVLTKLGEMDLFNLPNIKGLSEKTLLQKLNQNNIGEVKQQIIWEKVRSLRNDIIQAEKLLGTFDKRIIDLDDYKLLLIKWGCKSYIKYFEDNGYDIISTWRTWTKQKLMNEFGMKRGHAESFIKHKDAYFDKYWKEQNLIDINEEDDNKVEIMRILKHWKLSQYVEKFIEKGYDAIEDWKNIPKDELMNQLGMKPGHASRFIKNAT